MNEDGCAYVGHVSLWGWSGGVLLGGYGCACVGYELCVRVGVEWRCAIGRVWVYVCGL